MEAVGQPAVWSPPLGKLKRRVRELRLTSFSYYDPPANRPRLDLRHHESARLAVDCLLSQSVERYRQVLNTEGEVDFLSDLDKEYIRENGRDVDTVDPDPVFEEGDEDLESSSVDSQSVLVCPALSTDTDRPNVDRPRDVRVKASVLDRPGTEVYFHSGLKDLIREFIRKTTKTLSIVLDRFSDIELLCDLLEVSGKKDVSVHLLLDHMNLNLFVSMWRDLSLDSSDFPRFSVRGVDGHTYCARTGRKVTGQISECFIISDSSEVLTGTYSFSWMSWQVHRSLAVVLKGSAVAPFEQEFQRLLHSSRPIPGFDAVPHSLSTSTSPAAQNDTDTGKRRSKLDKDSLVRDWIGSEDAPQSVTLTGVQSSGVPPPQQTEPLYAAGTHAHRKALLQIQIQTQMYQKPLIQPGALLSLERQRHVVGGAFTQLHAKAGVDPLEEKNTQIKAQTHFHSHSNPLGGPFSYVQSPITTAATYHSHLSLDYLNVVPEGPFVQQRTSRLTKPSDVTAGVIAQREQWSYSLNMKQNMDLLFDHPSVLCPSTLQQRLWKADSQFPLNPPRGSASGLESFAGQFSSQYTLRSQDSKSESESRDGLDTDGMLILNRPSRLKWSLTGSPRPKAASALDIAKRMSTAQTGGASSQQDDVGGKQQELVGLHPLPTLIQLRPDRHRMFDRTQNM